MAALLDQAARAEVSHQLACAEGPGRDLVAVVDAIGQSAERRRANGDHVAGLVREAAAGLITVAYRRKRRAHEQGEPVGILVLVVERLRCELERVSADLRQIVASLQAE